VGVNNTDVKVAVDVEDEDAVVEDRDDEVTAVMELDDVVLAAWVCNVDELVNDVTEPPV